VLGGLALLSPVQRRLFQAGAACAKPAPKLKYIRGRLHIDLHVDLCYNKDIPDNKYVLDKQEALRLVGAPDFC